MSLDTYGGLKTAIGTWLNRPDLTSYIPDFIKLAEQRLFYGGDMPFQSEPLRIPAMQTQETGSITSSTISFPTGFLEPIRVATSSGGTTWSLGYVAPERFSELSSSASLPAVYTYLNNSIQTAGTGSATYVLDYYKAFTSLSADADTNWALSNIPGVYLYASLLESAPFLGDDPKLQLWSSMLNSSINAANRSTKYQGGGSLATRVVR